MYRGKTYNWRCYRVTAPSHIFVVFIKALLSGHHSIDLKEFLTQRVKFELERILSLDLRKVYSLGLLATQLLNFPSSENSSGFNFEHCSLSFQIQKSQ